MARNGGRARARFRRSGSGSDDRAPRRNPLGCLAARRVLQSFLDGEVTAERAAAVAAHLERCSRCQFEAETLREVVAALHQLRPELDPSVARRLVTTVERLCGPEHG